MKFQKKAFRYSLALIATLFISNAKDLEFDSEQKYTIENEYNGQILGQYSSNPPQLAPRILTNDKEIHIFSKVENGKTYYSFASPYGMQTSDPNKYKRFAPPDEDGGMLTLKESGPIWWEVIPHISKDGHSYGYVYLKNQETGLYMKDTTSIDNNLNLRAPNRSKDGSFVTATKLGDPDDRRFLWQITPNISTPPDANLALPQSGWTPKANKIAIFSTSEQISAPTFTVSSEDGKVLFSSQAVYWGQYWDNMHFYTLNLNDTKLEEEGTYQIEVSGVKKKIYIKSDTFIHPKREEGSDTFSIREIFNPDFGFITQWGRLTNWWPKAYEFLDSLEYWSPWETSSPNTFPEWMWRDDSDANGNGKTYESYGSKATYDEANSCYEGGWDMTDQYSHNYALDGLVLFELSQMYHNANNDELKDKIYQEILYGVNGLLKRQEDDGSWRQGYMDKIKWTGTNAGLGAGLASTLPIISERDSSLASSIKEALDKSWNYVRSRVDDPSTWAVAGEGILPDGSTVASNLPSQRNLWRESYLLFASTMYENTKDPTYKDVLENEIPQGVIAYNGWIKKGGGKLVGQFTAHGEWALVALLKYYPYASDEVKKNIEEIAQTYYNDNIISSKYAGGPYGAYGRYLASYSPAYTWQVWKNMMCATLLYETFGEKYGEGMVLAQKALDWYWGSNPYSSSLVFGVGDFYINSGWASYHTIGRHTGVEVSNMHIKGFDGSWAATETTVMGSLAVWNSAILLDKYRNTLQGVEVFSDESYKNKRLFLPAGKYNSDLLKAYGMDINEISSVKVPKGFLIKFYTEDNFSGDIEEVNQDLETLKSTNNKVKSIEVVYTGKIMPPTGASSQDSDDKADATDSTDKVDTTSTDTQTTTIDPDPQDSNDKADATDSTDKVDTTGTDTQTTTTDPDPQDSNDKADATDSTDKVDTTSTDTQTTTTDPDPQDSNDKADATDSTDKVDTTDTQIQVIVKPDPKSDPKKSKNRNRNHKKPDRKNQKPEKKPDTKPKSKPELKKPKDRVDLNKTKKGREFIEKNSTLQAMTPNSQTEFQEEKGENTKAKDSKSANNQELKDANKNNSQKSQSEVNNSTPTAVAGASGVFGVLFGVMIFLFSALRFKD